MGWCGDLHLVAIEEGVAPVLVDKEDVGFLWQLWWRLEDAPQALKGARTPHDAPHLHTCLEVVRLLRILLLSHFGPDHPAGDHRAAPSVHVNPCAARPLQLARVSAPSLVLADSGLRRSERQTCQWKT